MKNSIYYIILTIFLFAFANIKAQQPVVHYDMPVCGNQNWKSPNDTLLWHEPYWWDAANMRPDFCEETVDLCLNVKDTCAGLHIGFTLFLDLDGNNIQETVLPSGQLGAGGLGWNNLRFNNLYTPNYSGGDARTFDERPVAADRKYGFAMEEFATDSGKIVCVRFNTEAAPDSFFPIQLPHGRHRIVWTVSDSCGFGEEYDYAFMVKDCEAPVVTCKSHFTSTYGQGNTVKLEVPDFLQMSTDNCTASDKIAAGIRRCGDGAGFPLEASGNAQSALYFYCCEADVQCIELWTKDAAGNTDSCTTTIYLPDPGNCECSNAVSGNLTTENGQGIEGAMVKVDLSIPFAPPSSLSAVADSSGKYLVKGLVPFADVSIKPQRKDNPLNGVTTYDLVLISKHILGLELLSSPYKMIAADANKSNSITSFDVVELRKLILGIYPQLPANDSWRFVDKAFVFPDPQNPFQTAFPESILLDDLGLDAYHQDFTGVKVGDVNGSAVPNVVQEAQDRSWLPLQFDVEDRELDAREFFEVRFTAEVPLDAFQFTLVLEGLKALEVIQSENVAAENFNLELERAVTVSIDGAQAFSLRFQALKTGRLCDMLKLTGDITPAEAYLQGDTFSPELHFWKTEKRGNF